MKHTFLLLPLRQSAKLMASFGVNVPPGIACTTVDEVVKAVMEIGGDKARFLTADFDLANKWATDALLNSLTLRLHRKTDMGPDIFPLVEQIGTLAGERRVLD